MLALALAGCAQDSGVGERVGGTGGAGRSAGQVAAIPVADRQPLPALSAPTLGGGQLDLASFRGRVLVINVWGSWCSPCRAEAPELEKVYQATRARGVEFVGINTRDPRTANAQAFVRTFKLTFPSLLDPDGALLARFNGTVPAQFVPSTLVVDRQGRIAAIAFKGLTATDLRALLDPVLAERS